MSRKGKQSKRMLFLTLTVGFTLAQAILLGSASAQSSTQLAAAMRQQEPAATVEIPAQMSFLQLAPLLRRVQDTERTSTDGVAGKLMILGEATAHLDKDQAEGVGSVGLAYLNSYFWGRVLLTSSTQQRISPEDGAQVAYGTSILWPNKNGRGATLDVSWLGLPTDGSVRLGAFGSFDAKDLVWNVGTEEENLVLIGVGGGARLMASFQGKNEVVTSLDLGFFARRIGGDDDFRRLAISTDDNFFWGFLGGASLYINKIRAHFALTYVGGELDVDGLSGVQLMVGIGFEDGVIVN